MAKKKLTWADLSHRPVAAMMNNFGFIMLVGFCCLIYIANSHYAEKNIRRIQTLEKEVKEKRWYFMSLQSENMVNAMQSVLVDKVADNGLRLQRGNINKVIVPKDDD